MDVPADALRKCHDVRDGAQPAPYDVARGSELPASSVLASVQCVGARLEAEMQHCAETFWTNHHDDAAVDAQAAVHALQIDAG